MPVSTSKRYNLLSAFLAFILWGGWAFWINREFGESTQIVSALTQGTASFLITLVMVRIVSWVYNRTGHGVIGLFLSPVITVFFTGSLLVMVHRIVGTPEIVKTVTPALTVAFGFCLFTAFQLHSKSILTHAK